MLIIYIKDTIGNVINANLAPTGYNLKGLLKQIKKRSFGKFLFWSNFAIPNNL